MDKEKLQAAAAAGIITEAQVESLSAFLADDSTGAAKEPLRFLRNVSDVFIAVGIGLLSFAFTQMDLTGYYNLIPVVVFFIAAEWLVRIRRMVLPGIALLLVILMFAGFVIDFAEAGQGKLRATYVTAAALLFFLRYRTPFSVLPLASSSLITLAFYLDIGPSQVGYVAMIYGVLVFAIAMWCDAHDVKRESRLSDTAFWLHLIAAPMISHGVNQAALGSGLPYPEVLVLLLFLFFFALALFVDRRAILISSLCYAVYALIQIFDNKVFVYLLFGVLVIVSGAYWEKVRNMLFYNARSWRLSRYVPAFGDADSDLKRIK